jgi:hypothetical protein
MLEFGVLAPGQNLRPWVHPVPSILELRLPPPGFPLHNSYTQVPVKLLAVRRCPLLHSNVLPLMRPSRAFQHRLILRLSIPPRGDFLYSQHLYRQMPTLPQVIPISMPPNSMVLLLCLILGGAETVT